MRPWCWERSKAGEGDGRGRDGWMASPTQWTWVWASSGSWWWTGKPGVLQSMGSQRVGHDWATELTDWGPITHCITEWRSEQAAVSAADLVMVIGRLAIFPFFLFVCFVLCNVAAAAKSLQSCLTLCDPIPGFSRQQHWSGLPFPSPVHKSEKWKWNRSVMSDSSPPHGL